MNVTDHANQPLETNTNAHMEQSSFSATPGNSLPEDLLIDLIADLFNQAPVALIRLQGENYTVEMANPLACQLWGRQPTDLLGKPLLEVLPELKEQGLQAQLDSVFNSGNSQVGQELRLQLERNVKKEVVYFNFIYYPIKNQQGTIVGVSVIATDITGQVLARKAIEEQARQIELILNEIPQMVWTANPDGVHTFFNQKWYEFMWEANTPVAQTWQAHLHPDDLASTLSLWQACVKSKEPMYTQYRLRNKQGDYRWMMSQVIPSRDAGGVITQWIGSCTDIHEQRLATEQVHQQQAQWRALIDNTPDVITRWDSNLRLIIANTAFQTQTGIEMPSLLGKTNLEMGQPPEIAQPWMETLKQVIQTGKPAQHYHHFPSSQGKVYFYYRLVPEFAADGVLESVLAIGRDISELREAKNELDLAFFELDSFVYRASHDIMAPLKSILGLVQLLHLENSPVDQNKYLDLIERSIGKLDIFVQDLTNYSRNSRLPIQVLPIDFHQLIAESLQELSFMSGAERVKVSIKVDQQALFYSDPMRIRVLFHNFISNTFKYQNFQIMDPYLSIWVSCTQKQTEIVIEDNGKGIEKEFLNKIFDMFYRASADSFGSGLGLYIVKQVIEKLGGEITQVESELGKGTRFTIVLPNQSAMASS